MRLALLVCCCALSACVTTRPLPPSAEWLARVSELQNAGDWRLDGRAAVALALVLKQSPAGLSLNGAPPSDAVMAQVQEKLGFDPPIDNLHYWLLGVPNPGSTFDVSRNEQDRAMTLSQDGWSIAYDRYMPVAGDVLPARLVVSRDAVRVRIVIDHWDWPK